MQDLAFGSEHVQNNLNLFGPSLLTVFLTQGFLCPLQSSGTSSLITGLSSDLFLLSLILLFGFNIVLSLLSVASFVDLNVKVKLPTDLVVLNVIFDSTLGFLLSVSKFSKLSDDFLLLFTGIVKD